MDTKRRYWNHYWSSSWGVWKQRTFENKLKCIALLEALCEIEKEIKELTNRLKPLIRDDASFRNEVASQTQYSLRIKKIKIKAKRFCWENWQWRHWSS